MRYPEPKPSQWKPLVFDDEYAAGMAAQRFQWLAEWDPFIAMFGSDTIARMSNMIFSKDVLGFDRLDFDSKSDISNRVVGALGVSPFGFLLTYSCQERIVSLVTTAVLAGHDL